MRKLPLRETHKLLLRKMRKLPLRETRPRSDALPAAASQWQRASGSCRAARFSCLEAVHAVWFVPCGDLLKAVCLVLFKAVCLVLFKAVCFGPF